MKKLILTLCISTTLFGFAQITDENGNQASSASNTLTGNIGIGTTATNPTEQLEVHGRAIIKPDVTNNNYLRVTSNSATQTNLIYYNSGQARWNLYNVGDGFRFRKAGASALEVMALLSNGNVGIGTTGPQEKLHIKDGNLLIEMDANPTSKPQLLFHNPDDPNNIAQTFYRWSGSSSNYHGSRITQDANLFKIQRSNTATIGNHTWTDAVVVASNGRVGIGTTNPNGKTHIATENGNTNSLVLGRKDNQNYWNINHAGDDFRLYNTATTGSDFIIGLDTLGNERDNKVGIGTGNFNQNGGGSKLLVNGKILCEEVEVIQSVTPDYVFQKYYTGKSSLKADYTMPTLEEVEAFTKANHHLPEVPSAAEIEKEGLQLKEMTNLLLQKVEELTLYTIEQEKRIKALEAQLAKQ